MKIGHVVNRFTKRYTKRYSETVDYDIQCVTKYDDYISITIPVNNEKEITIQFTQEELHRLLNI